MANVIPTIPPADRPAEGQVEGVLVPSLIGGLGVGEVGVVAHVHGGVAV